MAQKVLQGGTRGYTHHPQLSRFRSHPDPLGAIGAFLQVIAAEGQSRGYRLESAKIAAIRPVESIPLTEGQLLYEWAHLLRKLEKRDPERFRLFTSTAQPDPHPLFRLGPGEVEPWERRAGL